MGLFNKKQKKEEIYCLDVRCNNCGEISTIEIDRGVLAEPIIKETECSNCGTKSLSKYKSIWKEAGFEK